MKVILSADCPQGSDLWWMAKQGIPSASCFDRIITGRGKLSKQAPRYIAELIADICQGARPPYFSARGKTVNTFAIQQGIDTEPKARDWLRLETDLRITEVGFCLDDRLEFGCSPDGLIDLEVDAEPEGTWQGLPYYNARAAGSLELKVPLLHTQIDRVLKGVMPREYIPQAHGQMIVCGVPWVEFCSWVDGPVAPFRLRVMEDEYTLAMRQALADFWVLFEASKKQFLPQGATT